MSERNDQSRTEAPSQRRRDEARDRGQVVYSGDLVVGIVLMVYAVAIHLSAQGWVPRMLGLLQQALLSIGGSDATRERFATQLETGLTDHAMLVGPLVFLIWSAAVAGSLVQTGLRVTPKSMELDWGRFSINKGFSRIFSSRSAVRGGLMIVKASLVVGVFVWSLADMADDGMGHWRSTLFLAVGQTGSQLANFGYRVALALIIFGLLEFGFEWWRNENELKMSLQEVKDERKQDEGDPHIRARIKKLQREMSQRRMMNDVPEANVVIRNPTHFAVALSYDRDSMQAPRVVAKGADFLALRIIEIAEENRIPVLERKELARALYANTEIGQEIPAPYYRAVAEILAFVFRLQNGS